MNVKLISWTNQNPLNLTSLAAKICYTSQIPDKNKLLDVKNILWQTGHHTTLEHFFVTFLIDEIAIGDITLGLHLVHPFYNTSQRSGRYASKIFWQPNWDKIKNYITTFWPEVSLAQQQKIANYIQEGIRTFQENHSKITNLAQTNLCQERPFILKKDLEKDATKIAQEQLRMFIPLIFPTALVYTINLVTLAAMQRTAWSPPMRYFIQTMVNLVLEKFPELKFAYNWDIHKDPDWSPELINQQYKIKTEPQLKIIRVSQSESSWPKPNEIGPLDLLQFKPSLMNLRLTKITTEIEISLATMGQDQRHRTLQRSQPKFTGNFYLPPLLQEAKMENKAKTILGKWLNLRNEIPKTLWMILAPYGAMIKYQKTGDLNAIIHEQNKRLCWRAQEEIYWLSCLFRQEIKNQKNFPLASELLKFISPPCLNGKCPEGLRYCGRNLKSKNWFPRRKV